jgi:polysaccharide chain length determinant protein (PEP-CTERM system associated)
MVTPQKVPADYVKPTVTSPIEDRLNSIRQEIMSRTQLEKVISEFNLYAGESKTLVSEEVVELMRKDINLTVGGKEGYFTLTYKGGDPVVVTKVTNRLASLFVEENLRQREQQAVGTTEFLGQELNATKARLEEQEKTLTEFKQKHIYEMPERMVANLGLLTQLRQDRQRISEALNSAQDRKLVIQRQIAEIKKQMALIKSATAQESAAESASQEAPVCLDCARNAQAAPPPSSGGPADSSRHMESLKARLSELQLKYTEKHPDIVSTRNAIKNLEKASASAEKEQPASKADNFDPQAAMTQEMEGQLAVTEEEIKSLKKEEARVNSSIASYQERVENAPLREMQMTELSRGYESAKDNYRRLLDKSEQAQQAENLEKRQKGEQFRLIDPARVPEKPIKPNVPRALFAGLALGIFFGVALVIGREFMDRSFRDARSMEAALGIKVLASIPRFEPKSG